MDENIPGLISTNDLLEMPDDPVFDEGYRAGWQDGFMVAASMILGELQFLRKPDRIMDYVLRYFNGPLAEWFIDGGASDPPIFDVACVYCGAPATQLDHVVPRSRGGSGDESNLVPACRACNISKRDRTPEQWKGVKPDAPAG